MFRKIITDTKELGAEAILFIGGEPLLRADLFDLVKYAKSIGLGTVIVTNGLLLNEENINKCFEAGVDWLSISIDAAKEKTFSKIRGEDLLAKITDNILLLNKMKEENKKEFPKMVSVCTIMDDNLEELLEVVKLSRDLEIEKVIFQPVVANNIDQTQREKDSSCAVPPSREDALHRSIKQLIKYKNESLSQFKFIANSIRNLKLIEKYFKGEVKAANLPCYAGYNRLQIVQEGKVYFCVNQKQYDANYGDVGIDSLKDLWYSKEAKFYRKLIRNCNSPCLQWCSYRDDFIELQEFPRSLLFKIKNKFRK